MLDTLVQNLKIELQKEVEAHGGSVTGSSTLTNQAIETAIERAGIQNEQTIGMGVNYEALLDYLCGFQLSYEVGPMQGEVLVCVRPGEGKTLLFGNPVMYLAIYII